MTVWPEDATGRTDARADESSETTQGGLAAARLQPEGTVVLLLTNEVSRKWAAGIAVELSEGWACGGRRIVLADLHFETPMLHAELDVSNMEGMVDIFLYGASLSRIARPVRDGEFYFIPAGTYAPDPTEIYRHPRWRKLVAGFQDAGATLVLFAPADGTDFDALGRWTSETIVLGPPPAEAFAEELERAGIRILAGLEPPLQTSSEADSAVEALESDAAAAEMAPRSSGVTQVHRPPESELELPPPPVRQGEPRRATSLILWFLLAVVILGAIGYLLLGMRAQGANGANPSGVAAAEGAAAAPTEQGEPLPYSVQVRAYTSLNAALEEAEAGQEQLPGAPFFVAPEEVQGILYYKILAGFSPDTTAAIQLRDRLVELDLVDPDDVVGPWGLIQYTPLTYDLGEFTTADAALARADSLREAEIPAYAAVVPYSDGSRRWRLYGGAYRDSTAAAGMRARLLEAGIVPRLTERTGLPATSTE